MGILRIDMNGSFGTSSKTFSAMDGGHADAVARAIEYLSSMVLPIAIQTDHSLHDNGEMPPNAAFGQGKAAGQTNDP
ncbi:hypothetical protein LCGC14_2240970 [marine sediment metagenome]|uniref:Uncharacterized protein n=1 Tax=marine sediment metagenome TaxID=412755 RepID=A0A0F9FI14_9ZZZZ